MDIERKALKDAKGDVGKAVTLLTERILSDKKFIDMMLPEWAKLWAYQKVHGAIAADRREVIVTNMQSKIDGGSCASFTSALKSAVASEKARFLDMRIFGGKRIADATADELRESARRYRELAEDTSIKSRFHAMIADAVDKAKAATAGQAVSEDQLSTLWNEAESANV